jgi:hypothetical protein
LKKPAVQSSSNLNTKKSSNANETEAFDTSDELLDDLVKNATLTASRDALKERKTARYGAQRRSRKSSTYALFDNYIDGLLCLFVVRRTLHLGLNEEERAEVLGTGKQH